MTRLEPLSEIVELYLGVGYGRFPTIRGIEWLRHFVTTCTLITLSQTTVIYFVIVIIMTAFHEILVA